MIAHGTGICRQPSSTPSRYSTTSRLSPEDGPPLQQLQPGWQVEAFVRALPPMLQPTLDAPAQSTAEDALQHIAYKRPSPSPTACS